MIAGIRTRSRDRLQPLAACDADASVALAARLEAVPVAGGGPCAVECRGDERLRESGWGGFSGPFSSCRDPQTALKFSYRSDSATRVDLWH